MERLEKLDTEAFLREMESEVRQALKKVADAVNGAADGQVINGSEVAVRDAMVEFQRKAHEKAVQMRIDSTESTFSPPKDASGKALRHRKGRSRRGTLCLSGRLELTRTRWEEVSGEDAGICRTPVDALLDQVESAVSLGVRELCCRLGIAGMSFKRSVENLFKASCLRMSEEVFRQVVESEGKLVIAAQQEELLPIEWSAAECKTKTPEGKEESLVYVSCDGVMVPLTTQAEKDQRRETVKQQRREKPRKKGVRRARLPAVKTGMDQRYKQLYLTSLYDQTQEHRLVSVTRGDHEAMGKLLGKSAAMIRLAGADKKVGLVDGAVCLRRHLEGLNLTAVGLDFCHLADHVGALDREPKPVAEAQASAKVPAAVQEKVPVAVQAKTPAVASTADEFGAASPRVESGKAVIAWGSAWARDVLHTVKHEGYEPFWEKLVAMRSSRRGKRRQSADHLLHYVARRKDMIAYDVFLKNGWDIGTGPMEAQCKATTRRIKGSGMRWDSENAEALVGLEALYQSHMWDSWWTRTRRGMNSGIPK